MFWRLARSGPTQTPSLRSTARGFLLRLQPKSSQKGATSQRLSRRWYTPLACSDSKGRQGIDSSQPVLIEKTQEPIPPSPSSERDSLSEKELELDYSKKRQTRKKQQQKQQQQQQQQIPQRAGQAHAHAPAQKEQKQKRKGRKAKEILRGFFVDMFVDGVGSAGSYYVSVGDVGVLAELDPRPLEPEPYFSRRSSGRRRRHVEKEEEAIPDRRRTYAYA